MRAKIRGIQEDLNTLSTQSRLESHFWLDCAKGFLQTPRIYQYCHMESVAQRSGWFGPRKRRILFQCLSFWDIHGHAAGLLPEATTIVRGSFLDTSWVLVWVLQHVSGLLYEKNHVTPRISTYLRDAMLDSGESKEGRPTGCWQSMASMSDRGTGIVWQSIWISRLFCRV